MSEKNTGYKNNQGSSNTETVDFINYEPHWIIRKANSLFLVLLLFMMAIIYFVKYPDTIKLPVTVILSDSLSFVISKTEAKEVGVNKIKIGQVVILKSVDTQKKKPEVLEARIRNIIHSVPSDSNWIIKLDVAYNENYNRDLLIHDTLNATAEIKVSEERLITKLIAQIKNGKL